MLTALHGAVRRLIHEHAQIPAGDVDVRFEAPRRDWVASLTRPTIDFFLFDVQENTELRQSGLESSRTARHAVHRVPARRFDLRYLVSALTTVVEDEHLLLWRTLVTLLRHETLPEDVLPSELRALDPAPSARVAQNDEAGAMLDVWNALETAPRPALLYVITVPVDLDFAVTSPLVLTRTAHYGPITPDGTADAVRARTQIGGIVRDARGVPQVGARVCVAGSAAEGATTRADGTFVLSGVPLGEATLRVTPAGRPPTLATLATVAIPSESYEVVVD